MILKERILRAVDTDGNLFDLSDEPSIPAIINGKDNDITLENLSRGVDLGQEESTIYVISLLSYFNVKDGKLVDAEGNTVQLLTSEKKPILIVDNTEEPDLYDEATITFDYIHAFSELVGINKPDELFADLLTDDEKQIFISERNVREAGAKKIADEAKEKTDAEAKKIADDTKLQSDADAKKQAEAEAISKIEPEYLVDERKYKKYQKFYEELQSFKEYIDGNIHLFYGDKWKEYSEDPFVLIKRAEGNWEDVETDVDNIIEEDKTVQLEFKDGEGWKNLTLDLEKGTISVVDVVKE